jgi:amino acid adenylation domain-containing protein
LVSAGGTPALPGKARRISLPTYPFERRRYWIEPKPEASFHPRPALFNPYEAPRDEAERKVAAIWQAVLGVAPVGAHDDFFQLGGHSLLAPQILVRVREAFGVDFPLQHVFSFPTPAELAEAIRFLQEDGPAPIPRSPLRSLLGETGGPYPLSFSQERLWFVDRLDPGNPIYNEPRAARVVGNLDVPALARSLRELVRRQETLRTFYREIGGEPVQAVSPEVSLALPEVDLSGLPEPLRREEERRCAAGEARWPFDLAVGPPLRTVLLRLAGGGDGEHVVLFTVHHIASDGWSLDLLVGEVAALYSAFSRGLPSPLPEPSVQYADFAAWQREQLRGEVLEAQLSYWREELSGAPLMLELPTDRPRPPVQSFRGALSEAVHLSPDVLVRLDELGRRAGASRFMTLLALFLSLLHRLSGQDDLLAGSPIANRTRPEIEGLVGFFVNLLVLRGRFGEKTTFGELLEQVRDTCLRAYAHQDLPFEKLVGELRPDRDLSRTPIFQVLFVLQNAPLDGIELPRLTLTASPVEAGVARYELTLAAAEAPDGGLLLRLEYATDLFDAATAARFARGFRSLAEGMVGDPERRVAELPLLSGEERRQVVEDWNRTERPRPEATLVELFAAQVERSPEAVAAVCEGRSLTYGELDRRARSWARLLAARGAGPESLVAILAPRGLDFLTGVLAVFQAGAAYLPLDPAQPEARAAAVLRQSGARWLLSGGGLGRALANPEIELLEMEDLAGLDAEPAAPVTAGPESLAYVIFTSGSTGLPKGVMIHHRGMLNHLLAKVEDLELTAADAVAQNASQSFDVSVWQLLCALLVGGRVHVYPDEVARDPAVLPAAAERDGLTILEVVPSLLASMLEAPEPPALERLRWMIATGEALPPEVCRRWLAVHPGIPLLNAYGPTECSDDVSHHVLRQPPGPRVVHTPIGRPVANTRLYVVNRELEPQPVGVPGELYAGGTGVGRGYLGRPELTAERFVPDVFSPEPGARLYRTGDLCRSRPDGAIEYLGRIDHQVKVRGFRIELGEIEAALGRHPGVREAVVLALGTGADKRLVAYVTPAGDGLRAWLRETLPEAMVPSGFVFLESMPLTPNGKVDRKALARIEPERREVESTPPRTPTEKAVARIWSDLLNVERIGLEDSFFDLGGHSLMGARVLSRVRDALGVEVPLRALFEAPVLEAFAARVAAADAVPAEPPSRLSPEEREGALPLSFAQERLWLLDRLDPGNPSYDILGFLRLAGPLDRPALERSLGEVVRRQGALRTRFPELDGRPVQVVAPAAGWTLPVVDLAALSAPGRELESRRLRREETLHRFDLARGPLLRTTLVRHAPEETVLLVNMHHVVSDGWSLGVLVDETAAIYEAFAGGLPSPLPEPPIQYVDHALWQRRWLAGPRLERLAAWWREELEGAPALLELPTDRPRPPVRRSRGARERMAFGEELTRAVHALALEQGATPFMVLLAAFQTLLYRYSGQPDVPVGSPVANRDWTEVEGLIGFFVNTLVLRGRLRSLHGGLTFRELLERTRATVLGAYAHQGLPFERLVEELRIERSLSHTPLFQVMLALQNVPAAKPRLRSLTLEPVEEPGATAKFDLNAELNEEDGALAGTLEYDADLFDAETVRRMIGHFRTLLQAAVERPGESVDRLPLLTDAERAELAAWNRTAVEYPDVCLHELIEAQVARTPEAVAVVFEGSTLTYRELDERASALARRLPASLVGICAERSLEMVVGLVAILKAGGAYVPLDPAYPAERLAFMLEDAAVPVLLTQEHLEGMKDIKDVKDTKDGKDERDPGRAAYAIFTSGSTGRPKGALNTHRGIVNRLLWMQAEYGLGPEDRVLQKTPFSFDVSVWEFFWPLIVGARLVVARPGGHQDPAYLVETIEREGITTLHFVPSMLQVFVEQPGVERCTSLRRVMASGEALPVDLAKRFFARLPAGVELHNLYGPTEAAVDVTYHACRPGEERVPIGRPVANTRIHILDREGQEVPVGIAGELHIGGVQVGRGYLHRPDLTAERFVPDGFEGVGARAGARMYRTGDLARWLVIGDIGEVEYLGRIDHQVKIRGFRIELGEIEAALAGHPEVREAVVLARDQSLVAFVAPPVSADLRAFLQASLPEHMIPAGFVSLDAMPLTPNGKVDRKALAGIEPESRSGAFLAPRTAAEEILAGIWRDLLGVARVGVKDRFFELGGHSLLGMRLAARVRDAFGVELPLRTLFEAPALEDLAARIGTASGAPVLPPIRPVPREGVLPLSFSQERLWFLDQLQPGSPFYNLSAALRLAGDLDVRALEMAFAEIVRRHEALRTTFPGTGGVPVQRIAPAAPASLPILDLSGLPDPEGEARRRVEELAALPFDLEAGPLLRLALLRLGEREHVLLIAMHHIVSDGWSLGVLVAEGGALYRAFVEGRRSPLPALPVQYADFAAWQRGWLRGEALDRQLAWWKEELGGAPTRLELPTDRPRPRVQTFRGAVRRLALAPELIAALADLAGREGATLYMVLLAAFQILLQRYSGQDDLLVGSPIAGRGRTELEPLIGFFVNTLVFRGRLQPDGPFRELLARVRSSTLGAFAHADVPFERLVEELEVERSLAWNPLVQVTFALQNVPGGPPELPGVTLTPMDVEWTAAKFDLNLVLAEQGGALAGTIEYAADLFDAAAVDRLAGHFRTLLEGVAAGASGPLSELPILSGDEARQVVVDWNRTRTGFPRQACLHELFDEQAARAPAAVAAVFGAESCTYRDLQARADRLAWHLIGQGVRPGSPVGIHMERSLGMIVAILAVLKAGGAYVPLDTSYPEERLAFMLADAGVRTVLRSADCPDSLASRSGRSPRVFAAPESLACLVYTSGSTGRPKGVALPHRAVVRLARETNYIRIRPDDVLTQASNTSFDAAIFEIWGALLNGARLVGVSKETLLSPRELAEQIRRDGVTTLFLTTAVFNQMGREEPGAFRRLRHLLFGGEAADAARVRQVLRDGRPERLLHFYGPAESTTFASWHLVEEVPEGATTVPIGMPVANTTLLVLDRGFNPVSAAPVGVPGEIFVGGEGLAWGYRNRPDLTAERFVPDPFALDEGGGGRLYRTGDLGRRGPDGAVEFLGRTDFQVKIRGFRIEPGEIEAALVAHPGVRDAAVLVLGEGSGKRLAAYVAGEAAIPELKAFLAERLAPFMIPAAWVVLESLPITPNGKVDRKALARIEPDAASEETAAGGFEPPRGLTEELLAGAWSEVLGVERIGRTDDFFGLGGHSLLATRLVSRVRGLFQAELPLRTLFEVSSLSGLAERIDLLRQEGAGLQPPPILRGGEREGPLSFAQERLWFLERLDPGTAFYNVPFALRLTGALDVGALAAALQEIVRRHEALRTTFGRIDGRDGRPWQRVSPPGGVPVPEFDLTGLPVELREPEAARLRRAEAFRPFDLQRGPLLRVLLVRLGAEERHAFLNVHHLVADGWSIGVLVRELGALYSGTGLPELPVQYLDFAAWQRGWLEGEVLRSHVEYWRERLRGARTVLDLPPDRPRPPVQTFRGAVRPLALPAALVRALEGLGRRQGATLFMTLLAAWQAVLYRYTGQDDVLVGSPVAGRDRRELEGLIGLFVNTVVLRGELADAEGREVTFAGLLERIRATALGAFAHQDLPFERLVDELRVERSLARHPVFQTVFAFNNTPWEGLSLPGVTLEPLAVDSGTTKVDLLLSLAEGTAGLEGGWEYSTDLFDASTIDRMTGHLRTLLEGAAADPSRRLGDLPLLSGPERHQALVEWNDTSEPAEPAEPGSLGELFEAAAARFPDHEAVVFEGRSLTYAGLSARAGRLAETLRALGVGPEERVAICAGEGIERVAAVLAVFRAGGAYLPLDPAHPRERLAWMLEDARVRVLLVQEGLREALPETAAVVVELALDASDEEASAAFGPHPRPLSHLAYVIYTSGSTGRPNGVPVRHRAAVHLIRQAVRQFQVDPSSRVLQSVSFSFDASVLETWLALSTGATLVICPRETRMSGPALAALIDGERITHAVLTPSSLGLLPADGLPTLRTASVGGDSCPGELASRWSPPSRAMRLLNCYGPTETTVYAVAQVCRGPFRREPPIGRPLGNTRAYVVDPAGPAGAPVPMGVPGELWLGGEGLAQGYLNRPRLTAERFRPDPFGEAGDRLYRTGDLVRLLPDGEMEFLGRADGQVKIRGLRIELGEIEAALGRHPAVAENAVLALGQGADRRLAAFVVARPGGEGSLVAQLREHLRLTLPDYMVPASFLFLEAMPLTPVGKVDRRGLAAMDLVQDGAQDGESGRVEARDVLELALARLWEEVLGRPRIGVRDNFFELGGHSLLAVRLLARVQERFGRDLPLAVLFQEGTVEQMAALLRGGDDAGGTPSCLIPIQPGGALAPFFCVHPAGGDVLCYAPLARHLGPDRPLYGLQSRGLSGGGEPVGTIPGMAALYLEEIRRVQPEGPYRIGGWSLGGVVAFEMARQLRERGEEEALLVLLDSALGMAAGEPEDDVDLLLDVVAYVANLWGGELSVSREELEAFDAGARLDRVLDLLRGAGFLPPGAGLDQLSRTLDVYRANLAAARAYRPQVGGEGGGAVLFRAAEAPGALADLPDLGWGRFLSGPLEIETVPGHHLNLLAEPNVRTLAERLRRCLNEADRKKVAV